MKTNNKNYILMPGTETYALGVKALREASSEGSSMQPIFTKPDGSWIVRPLTFKENIEARVNDYNTLNNSDGGERTNDERLRFFNMWLDSCTGIAYKAGTTKFKIVPQSLDLIEIPSEFKKGFLPVDYDSIDGVELDSRKSKYDSWLAATEDKALLSEYTGITFGLLTEKYDRTNGMGFWVRSNTETDELRALFVGNFYDISNANGNYVLNDGGSFLRVAPSQKISQGEQ